MVSSNIASEALASSTSAWSAKTIYGPTSEAMARYSVDIIGKKMRHVGFMTTYRWDRNLKLAKAQL